MPRNTDEPHSRTQPFPSAAASAGAGGVMAMDPSDDPVPGEGYYASPVRQSKPSTVEVVEGMGMDPRLQRIVALRQGGESTAATASSVPGEIPVIALVTDAAAWENMSEVRNPVHIGGEIVTGRIPVDRIEAVRRQPFVSSLKAARALKPSLNASLRETHSRPGDFGKLQAQGGRGAVVGIIDFGCDFQHENFRGEGGGTRIEAIWHQGGPNTPTSPFGYGRLYRQAEINTALRQANPYSSLGYGPVRDTASSQGTHGTHVMDIAAGNGAGSGFPGFAPEASIIFVDVASDDIAWSGPDVIGISFGDSVRLLEAARFIFDQAGDRPCVINISLGTNGGPHDGTTLVERGLDELVKQKPNRAVVIAASNSFSDGIHASGAVPEGEFIDLDWRRPPSSGWQDEMEIWYDGAEALDVELFMPDGTSLGLVGPGENGEARDDDGRVMVLVSSRQNDPTNGANMIGIYVRDGLPSGRWSARLHGKNVTTGAFHAWIERDDNSQASFMTFRDDAFTIGSISCGKETVIVGSYDAHKPTTPLSYFSSSGPTRDGRQKPDLAAPGHAVVAAHSRTMRDVTVKSGTSMAAPAVAGALAVLLAEAAARSIVLSASQSRDLLTLGARPAPGQNGWDPRWGKGRLDVAATLNLLGAGPVPVLVSGKSHRKPKKTASVPLHAQRRPPRKGNLARNDA